MVVARFVDRWHAPVLPGSKREHVATLVRILAPFTYRTIVNALNALFAAGTQFRPSASEMYAACLRQRYRDRRRQGHVTRLSEDEWMQKRIAETPQVSDAIARLEAALP